VYEVVAVADIGDVNVVVVMDDVEHAWHCVGQQHCELELPVRRLIATLSSRCRASTVRDSHDQAEQQPINNEDPLISTNSNHHRRAQAPGFRHGRIKLGGGGGGRNPPDSETYLTNGITDAI